MSLYLLSVPKEHSFQALTIRGLISLNMILKSVLLVVTALAENKIVFLYQLYLGKMQQQVCS